MEYRILTAWGPTAQEAAQRLEEQVRAYLSLGYELQGGVSYNVRKRTSQSTVYDDSTDLAQAMVKE